MEDVMIYKNSSPPLLIIAKEGIWKEGVWVFREGIEYVLKEIPEGKRFIKKILGLKKEPRFFTRTYFPPEKMNISTLTSYIQEYKKGGFETSDLETELQFKISSPFANFILMFLAVPLGIILKRGRGASFAVGLLLSFGYYETMAFFKALGKIGAADPFFSAWITNFLFILVGIILLWKME